MSESAPTPLPMLVASPPPGLAAEWHRALNVAAAKLAVAAGVSPAEVRRVSGLRRVEMRRSPGQIRRQMVALRKAASQTEDQICEALVNEVETVEPHSVGTMRRRNRLEVLADLSAGPPSRAASSVLRLRRSVQSRIRRTDR